VTEISSIIDLHARACDNTQRYVDAVKGDQWHDPTPCGDWDVREVLHHIVSGHLWVVPLMEGQTIEQVGDRLDGDVLGSDPVGSSRSSAVAAADAFRAPGAMDRPVAVSYGPIPGARYASHRFLDVLVHGWDLAKATGQDTALEDDLVAACWQIVEAERENFAASGMFDDAVVVPDDAPLQTRLLAALGRHA
jgi:uncharacterized protein (TIGR03086 family)